MKLILGSQSPRRKEILNYFDLSFTQIVSNFDEESIPFKNNPQEYVKTLAICKARVLKEDYPDSVILTADTIVYKEGKIYGKPKDENQAYQFLKELEGSWHSVFTGVALVDGSKEFQAFEETKVQFHKLSDEQIITYHRCLPSQDKAGGYLIQGAGGLIVKSIEGCYYNVVGLPLTSLSLLLKQVGIDLWSHLKNV